MLEEDALRFDAFLKENDEKVQEAIKKAETEAKAKQDKVCCSLPGLPSSISAVKYCHGTSAGQWSGPDKTDHHQQAAMCIGCHLPPNMCTRCLGLRLCNDATCHLKALSGASTNTPSKVPQYSNICTAC